MVSKEVELFSLPLKNTPIDEYIVFLTYLVIRTFAMMRWEVCHYGKIGGVQKYIDYQEFLAQIGFLVPSDFVDKAWEDFLTLYEELYRFWIEMDMPDVYTPVVYESIGGYHVIEVNFDYQKF